MRTALAAASIVVAACFELASAATFAQGRAGAADCVTIGKPSPEKSYVTQHIESTGKSSMVTHVWESVTETGSRLRWAGPAGTSIQVNAHRIVDDVSVLDRMSKLDLNGVTLESTTFRPGIVGDPAFRACVGRSWAIPSVTAIFQSGTIKVTSATPAGTLRIVSIRERVTVPAGMFEAVRYVRTSQSTDEYWKSLEHGVVVKHIGKVGANTVTETLLAIK